MTEIQALEQLWQRHDQTGYTALAVFVGLAIWKRYALDIWDRLPGWVQFGIPFVVVGGTQFAETLAKDRAATLVVALFSALGAALGLVGTYHGAKRAPLVGRLLRRPVPPAERETDPPEVDPPASTTTAAIVLVLLLGGCAPAKSASDAVAYVCQGYLAAAPEVQAQAKREGVSPLVVAEAICLLNDAGRFVWELFSVEGPDGKRTATPAGDLDRARARALVVAREQGAIQ